MREILSNKYYIIAVSALSFILFLLVLIPGCTSDEDEYDDLYDPDDYISSSGDTADEPTDEEIIQDAIAADVKDDDDEIVATVPFGRDNFGGYDMIVDKSGIYRFTAANLPDTAKNVSWNIYVFEEPYKFGTNYMIKNFDPEIETDSDITLYKGQYVYCVCSTNEYNYDNASILAYLKISFLNEVSDSFHILHEHEYKAKKDEAFCEKEGYTIYECSCGESYIESIKPLDHDYEEEITEPTCTEAGFTTFTCKNCDDTYEEPGDEATGHIPNKEKLYQFADRHEYECSECEERIKEDHDSKKSAGVTGITNKNGDVQYYSIIVTETCTICNYSAPIQLPAAEHKASSFNYDKNSGTLTFVCHDCGSLSYKCDIYLDYEVGNDTSSSSDSEADSSSDSGGNSSSDSGTDTGADSSTDSSTGSSENSSSSSSAE